MRLTTHLQIHFKRAKFSRTNRQLFAALMEYYR